MGQAWIRVETRYRSVSDQPRCNNSWIDFFIQIGRYCILQYMPFLYCSCQEMSDMCGQENNRQFR